MIRYPMVISAGAVLATLVYASYLDIRDRRVPFRTWYPMLAVGIPATLWLLYETTASYSLMAGYLTVVAGFLYANYLDGFEAGDRLMFPFLALVLILPALAWLVLPRPFSIPLLPWYAMYAGIFGYISYRVYTRQPEEKSPRKRGIPEQAVGEVLDRWYFILIITILAITAVLLLFSGGWGAPALFVLVPAVFCGVFYCFGRMHLFGGADAWALIGISFCIPTFPFTPLLGSPPLGFLSFSALINALLLNLAAPLGIFLINVFRGNRAPLIYMFFGFPVKGATIRESWGFVMEEFTEEQDGTLSRKFIGFLDALRRMYAGEGRIYTKDLREHPEEYSRELQMYGKAQNVWISYAVPFIVPITAGFITAVLLGDLLLAITKVFTGGA